MPMCAMQTGQQRNRISLIFRRLTVDRQASSLSPGAAGCSVLPLAHADNKKSPGTGGGTDSTTAPPLPPRSSNRFAKAKRKVGLFINVETAMFSSRPAVCPSAAHAGPGKDRQRGMIIASRTRSRVLLRLQHHPRQTRVHRQLDWSWRPIDVSL